MHSEIERESHLANWEYCPNNVGGLASSHSKYCAFLINGRQEGALLELVLNAFRRHGLTIGSFRAFTDRKKKEYAIYVTSDFSNGNISPFELAGELRRTKLVGGAIYVSLKERLFDGFLFPLTILDTERVVAMDSSFAFQIQEQLNTEAGRTLLNGLGRKYVTRMCENVRKKNGKNRLLQNVLDYLKCAGWGSFEIAKRDASIIEVTIKDPPVSKITGEASGNSFVHGMAAELLDLLQSQGRFELRQESYDRPTRLLTMILEGTESRNREPSTFSGKETRHERVPRAATAEVEKVVSLLLHKPRISREEEITEEERRISVTTSGKETASVKQGFSEIPKQIPKNLVTKRLKIIVDA